jgi:hypothetical protein
MIREKTYNEYEKLTCSATTTTTVPPPNNSTDHWPNLPRGRLVGDTTETHDNELSIWTILKYVSRELSLNPQHSTHLFIIAAFCKGRYHVLL